MVTISRHETEILRLVALKGSCSIAEIAEQLAVSDETVRRHIRPLVEQGRVHKVHGGVVMPDRLREAPMERRMGENHEAKKAIANATAALIASGDSILMDTGSTTAYVASALTDHSNLRVITNSTEIARILSRQSSNKVYMVGGEISGDQLATFGPAALNFVRQFNVRHAILSIGGINERHELLDFDLGEAEFSRAVIEQASHITVVADHTKFSRKALVKVCAIDAVDIFVTDVPPPDAFTNALQQADGQLIITRQ